MRRIREIWGIPITGWLCAGGSGLLLTLGFAPFSQPIAGWVGLIPLAYYGQRNSPEPRAAFLLGWFFGFSHFLTSLSWLQTVTVAGWAVLSAYLAVYPALWFVLWVRFAGPDPDRMTSGGNIRHSLLGASAWVLTEWLRGVVFTGFGWNSLGVSQGDLLLIAQVADLGGVLLVSWVVAFAGLTLTLTARRFELEIRGSQKWRPRWDFTAGVVVVGLAMVYGARTLLRPWPEPAATLRYAAIQPAVPQDPWRSAKVARVAEELGRWSELALVGGGPVDLLVWPESLAGSGWREEPELQAAMQAARRTGARALFDRIAGCPWAGDLQLRCFVPGAGGKTPGGLRQDPSGGDGGVCAFCGCFSVVEEIGSPGRGSHGRTGSGVAHPGIPWDPDGPVDLF